MPPTDGFPRHHRFTCSEYHALARIGVLSPDEPVELIEGQIYRKPSPTPERSACVRRLHRVLLRQANGRYTVGKLAPVTLNETSEAVPDLTLLRARQDCGSMPYPMPEDVQLLVEVAAATIEFDRVTKLPIYARSGIPEVWLIDLAAETVEIHQQPSETGYRHVRRLGRKDRLSPLVFPELELTGSDILPQAPERTPEPVGTDRWRAWLSDAERLTSEIRSRLGEDLDVDDLLAQSRKDLENRGE